MDGFGILLALANHGGLNVVSNTLRNYVTWSLIDPPEGAQFNEKTQSWHGLGLNAVYPEDAAAEVFAAYALLNTDHLSPESAKHCRAIGRHILRTANPLNLVNVTGFRVLVVKSSDTIGWKSSKLIFFSFEWLASFSEFAGIPVTEEHNLLRNHFLWDQRDHFAWALAFPERAAKEQEEINKAETWIGAETSL